MTTRISKENFCAFHITLSAHFVIWVSPRIYALILGYCYGLCYWKRWFQYSVCDTGTNMILSLLKNSKKTWRDDVITVVAMLTIVAINHNCRNTNHNCLNCNCNLIISNMPPEYTCLPIKFLGWHNTVPQCAVCYTLLTNHDMMSGIQQTFPAVISCRFLKGPGNW